MSKIAIWILFITNTLKMQHIQSHAMIEKHDVVNFK